jgi:hypothetical protein
MAGVAGMGSPRNLKQPVPEQIDVASMVPDVATMQVNAPIAPNSPGEPVAPEIDYDALAAEAIATDEMAANIDYDALAASAIAEEDQSLGAQASDYGKELKARFKAGFGGSPKQKKKILSDIYGEDNVELDGEDIFVTKNGKKEKFTRGMLDMAADLFAFGNPISDLKTKGEAAANLGRDAADLGKPIIAEAVTLPYEAVGGLLGTGAAPGPGTVAGIAGGRFLGGAAGERVATAVGDLMGAEFAPNETELDKGGRALISGGGRAVLGLGFDKLGSVIAARNADKAARKAIDTIDTEVKTAIGDLDSAVKILDESGVDTKLPTSFGDKSGEISYLPEQAARASDLSPGIQKTAQSLTNNKEYVRVNNKLKEISSNAVEKVHALISNAGVKGGEKTGAKFLQYADDVDAAEGALIGEFRKKAAEEAGDGVIPLTNLKTKLQELGERFDPKDPQSVINASMASTEPEAKAFIANYEKLYNAAAKDGGRVQMRDLDQLYNQISQTAKPYWKKDSLVGNSLQDLWRGVRDDYTQGVKVLLDEGRVKSFSPKSYDDALTRFSEIKDASGQLKTILNKSAITTEALSDVIYGGGTNSLQTLNATKSLLKDSPELMQQIRQAKLQKFMDKAYSSKTGKFSGVTYVDQIKKLPKEVQMDLVGGEGQMNLLKAMQTYTNRVENYSVKNIAESDEAKKAVSSIVGAMTSNLKYKSDAVFNMLRGAGKDRALVQYLTGPGQTEVLKLLPTNQRSAASKVIDEILRTDGKLLTRGAQMSGKQMIQPEPSDNQETP